MTSTLSGSSAALHTPEAGGAPRNMRRLLLPGIGLFAAILSFIGSGIPSYWGDEAASVVSAGRSLPSLFMALAHIDAVHGTYYVFLHFWIGLVGSSELMVRLPSAIAVGFAAAGVVALGRQLFGTPTGVVAGLVFAILPQVTRMGEEARSYAFTMAAAVWLTYWLVALVRRGERRRRSWVLYGVAVAASLYLFLYIAMLAFVHIAVLMMFRPGREVVRAWVRSLALAAVLALPIIIFGFIERGQIGFLARRDYANADSVLVGQWFGSTWFAIAAWALIIAGVVATMRANRNSLARRGGIVIIVWLAVPTAVLLMANAWITPMYTPRYLSFCTPAVAILLALGIRYLWRRIPEARLRLPAAIAVAVVLVLLAAPVYIDQRGPFGKDGGSDFRQAADVIAANASPGDAIVFDESVKPSRHPRLALNLYPASFAGLDDVALITPLAERTTLWDEVAPVASLGSALDSHSVVWVVEGSARTPDVTALKSLGFVVDRSIPVHRETVIRMMRSTP